MNSFKAQLAYGLKYNKRYLLLGLALDATVIAAGIAIGLRLLGCR